MSKGVVSVFGLAVFALLLVQPGVEARTTASGGVDGRVEFRPEGVPSTLDITGVELSKSGMPSARYYRLSKGSPAGKPWIVFVPGSGCAGGLALQPNGKAQGGLELFALPHLAEANLYVLEPPGIPRQFAPPESGLSEGCPVSFLTRDSFTDVMHDYGAAVDDIRSHASPGTPVMFVGMSDGVVFAAQLAVDTPGTKAVALISGFGISQNVSQTSALLDEALSDRIDAKSVEMIHDQQTTLSEALAHPTSLTLWNGHPMSRLGTTANVSSADLVRRLPRGIKLLVVQGGKDTNWSPDAFRAGLAEVINAGRGVTVRYIPCGDHQLGCGTAAPAPKYAGDTVRQAVTWFLGGKPDPTWVTFEGRDSVPRKP